MAAPNTATGVEVKVADGPTPDEAGVIDGLAVAVSAVVSDAIVGVANAGRPFWAAFADEPVVAVSAVVTAVTVDVANGIALSLAAAGGVCVGGT